MGREGMPQRVRTYVMNLRGKANVFLNHSSYRSCCHTYALVIKNQRLGIGLSCRPVTERPQRSLTGESEKATSVIKEWFRFSSYCAAIVSCPSYFGGHPKLNYVVVHVSHVLNFSCCCSPTAKAFERQNVSRVVAPIRCVF